MKELLGRRDEERCRFFVRKRRERLVLATGPLEFNARADHLDDIGPREEVMNEGLGDAAAHDVSLPPVLLLQERRRDGAAGGSTEFGLDQARQLAHVGATRNTRLDPRHDLAHVLAGRGAGFGNGLIEQGADFRVGQLLRQVAEQHLDFGRFLVRQIRPVAAAELVFRVATLLDHLFDGRRHDGVGNRRALDDFALLELGRQHA